MPCDDDRFGPGTIREDGRTLHPVHLFAVKTPSEGRGQYDYCKLLRITAGDEAFRPLAEGNCSLVHG